jgi:hypothetical protein
MQFTEKIGRWYVVALWCAAAYFCISNISISAFGTEDAKYMFYASAFIVGAYGIARRQRWGRQFSLILWAIFGYWDFGALGFYAEMRWFPLVALALLFAALLWLISPAALGQTLEAVRPT